MCPQFAKVTHESSFCSGFGWWWVRAGEAQEAAEIDSKNDVHNQGRWKLVLLTLTGFGQDAKCMWLMGAAVLDMLAQRRAWGHGHSMWRASKNNQFREWGCPRCVYVLFWVSFGCKVKEIQKSCKCMKFHPHEEASAGSMHIKVLKVALSEGKLFCLCCVWERPVEGFRMK